MAYIKKADRKPKEVIVPTNISELKSTLSPVDLAYVERLEATIPKACPPKSKRLFLFGNFHLLRELGITNKAIHPQLITGLIHLAENAQDDDTKCDAETLLALHGSTQVFGWVE